jgi:dTDP-4-dehydrorhamnose reductase
MARLLITGATGQLGGYLLLRLAPAGADITAWSGSREGEVFGIPVRPVDLGDADAVARAFREARPTAVIHAGALASVAACHRDPELARRVNAQGSALLAGLTAAAGARLLLVSTDLVFDGEKGGYEEKDAPAPLSVYGRTKVQAEAAVLAHPRTAVARVSLLLGPSLTGRASFFDQQLHALRAGRPITCFADEWRTPLGLDTAAAALIGLAEAGFEGLLHVGGPWRLSRLEMGRRLAAMVGADLGLVVAASRTQIPAAEPRPRDTSLNSAKWRGLFPGQPWPTWHETLAAVGPDS